NSSEEGSTSSRSTGPMSNLGADERRAGARECAVRLLEMSRVYENVTVPAGSLTSGRIIVAIVARQRSHLRAIIQRADADLALERRLGGPPAYPGLQAQATAIGNRIDYSLGYRLHSQGAAHPNALALKSLLQQLPGDELQVLAEPTPENRLNVYGTGAVYLHEALYWAGELIPQLQIDGLDEIGAQLTELAIMRVD